MNKAVQQSIIAMVLALVAFFGMIRYKAGIGVQDPSMVSSLERIKSLQQQVEQLEHEKQQLMETVKTFQAKMADLERSAGEGNAYIKELTDQLDEARIMAGLVELEGPGVQVTLDDSDKQLIEGADVNAYLVHEEDLLNVINDLKAAGAEALSLNGQRLLANTQVKCGGPTVTVANERFVPPFVISAIGDPAMLERILIQPGGLYDILRYWGIKINVKRMDKLTVPAYYGPVSFSYAHPTNSEGR